MITLAALCVKRYDFLQGLFESAERGTRKPDRYVVVDNGGGLRFSGAKLPPNTDVISPGRNLGVAASWNLVLDQYDDYVIFSNDDVLLEPNLIGLFEKAAVESDALFVFPKMDPPTTFCVFLLKKEGHRVVGRFDERFWPCYYEDCDYHRRIKDKGIKEHIFEGAGYQHLGNGTIKSMTAAENTRLHQQMEKSCDYYVAKWGGPPGSETRTTPAEVP